MKDDLIQVERKFCKRCNTLLLPTQEASKLRLLGTHLALFDNMQYDEGEKGYKNQHLYILNSNEEIKEGDWLLNSRNELDRGRDKYIHPLCDKKIVATTNSGLRWNEDRVIQIIDYHHAQLPRPSDAFISKYIEEYNKGNIIKEVLVEYEPGNEYIKHTDGHRDGWGRMPNKLKVAPDGSITIKPVKGKLYNREDMINHCETALLAGYANGSLSPDKFRGVMKEWIEQNI